MLKLLQYYGKYQSARGVLGGMPGWARFLVLISALPAIALLVLSGVVLCVSILALLLLAVPVYRVLKGLTGGDEVAPNQPLWEQVPAEGRVDFVEPVEPVQPSVVVAEVMPQESASPPRERRHIDVRIVE